MPSVMPFMSMNLEERERWAYCAGLPLHRILARAADGDDELHEKINILEDKLKESEKEVEAFKTGMECAEIRYAEALKIPYDHRQALQKRMEQIDLLCAPM